MNKQPKFFNASTSGDTLTLSFYDVIGESIWDDSDTPAATPAAVAEALKGDFKTVELHLNSPGGDAFAGVAIYNLLKASPKTVNVIVDGIAASAASIIAMAGDTITMSTGSMLMIHEAMSLAFGNADVMAKMADTLATVTSGIADIYVAKTGLPKAEILAMQNAETWMTSDEAVAKGFATAVNKSKSAVKNAFDLSVFHNAPESIKTTVKTDEVAAETVAETPAIANDEAETVSEAQPDMTGVFTHMLEMNRRK